MSLKLPVAFVVACLLSGAALAAEVDGCTKFTWDVTHELAVFKGVPKPVAAGTKAGKEAPQLKLDQVYELKLANQTGVTFALQPGKPTLPDNAQAGVFRFHTEKAGRYRVGITSGHWIDVVDGDKLIKSRDFQGARGCERPHKIVEYELPANSDLTLQLSGATDVTVIVAVTAVAGAPAS
jgi:hypothetical protein